MDADDPRQKIQHNRRLIQKYTRHKRVIEEQIAGFGKLHAPSHLLLEVSDIDEQVWECETVIANAKEILKKPLQDKVNTLKYLYNGLSRLWSNMTEQNKRLEKMSNELYKIVMTWAHEIEGFNDVDISKSVDLVYERARDLEHVTDNEESELQQYKIALNKLNIAILDIGKQISEIERL